MCVVWRSFLGVADLIIANPLLSLSECIELVLEDSLYGESSHFINTLEENKLSCAVAIRSNHEQ